MQNFGTHTTPLTVQTNERFTALDVFRGLTICLMLIVNFPGSQENVFAPLLHAKWHGFTPADVVFPSFLFAVGNAMSFTISKWKTFSTWQVVYKVFKRTILIFLLGYLLFWFPFSNLIAVHPFTFPSFSDSHVLGVLQRIALVYCAASLLIYFLGIRNATIISIAILILYWFILLYFGTGADPLNIQTNAVLRFDRWVLGDNHLAHDGSFVFDAEGLLSTLPATGNVIAGYIAGKFVQQRGKTYEAISKLMITGFVVLLTAFFWNYILPFNKKLWTSSFVLLSTGLDCMLLACIIYYIDILKQSFGVYFFKVFGKNPLFIYIFSIALALMIFFIPAGNTILIDWIYTKLFSHAGAYTGSFLFAVFYMFLCWGVCYLLDKKKIYIKV